MCYSLRLTKTTTYVLNAMLRVQTCFLDSTLVVILFNTTK
jgi:hypothetical protein